MRELALVAVGSAVGGVLRYGVGVAIAARWASPFPAATLLVNVTGSFLLGMLATLLMGRADEAELRLLLLVGLCGGYTTFSSFSLETVRLVQRGEAGIAAVYVLASVVLSILGLAAGVLAMRALGATGGP